MPELTFEFFLISFLSVTFPLIDILIIVKMKIIMMMTIFFWFRLRKHFIGWLTIRLKNGLLEMLGGTLGERTSRPSVTTTSTEHPLVLIQLLYCYE